MRATKDQIKEALRAIESRDGVLHPEDVVAAARDEDSPLHDRFEWDDSVAGEKYRIEQARSLIRVVELDVTVHQRRIETVHYVHDPKAGKGGGYVSVERVRSDSERSVSVISQELDRVLNLLKRTHGLATVIGVDSQLSDIISRVERMSSDIVALFDKAA